MINNNAVAIIGWHDGCAGQVHAWFQETQEYEIICFVNPSDKPLKIDPTYIKRDVSEFSYPTSDSFKGISLINASDWALDLKTRGISKVLVTIDDALERMRQIMYARKNGFLLINAIHPSTLLMPDAKLGENIILYPKVYIGYRAEVGTGVFVNTGAQVDHHNVLLDCSTVDPGVIFAGNVTLGRYSRVHTGAIIKNRIRVGDYAIVGAGSVIINDVPKSATVVGVPGKVIKQSVWLE